MGRPLGANSRPAGRRLNVLLATVVSTGMVNLLAVQPAAAAPPRAQTGQVCTVVGTNGNDRLKAGYHRDVICGLGGNDTIVGGTGADVIDGGAGNDVLLGGNAADVLIGGVGVDTVSYADHGTAVAADLNGLVGDGSAGESDRVAADVENLTGGKGNDRLTGNGGTNVLAGGAGDDTLTGGAGDDVLGGDTGDDILNGDPGNDDLDGDAGDDSLDGGPGVDHLDGGTGTNVCVGDANDVEAGQSCSDVHAPVIDPASVTWVGDTHLDNASANTAVLRVDAKDDRSGVTGMWVRLNGPDNTNLWGAVSSPASGTPTDGTWEIPVDLPIGTTAGQWRLAELCARDILYHQTCYVLDDDGVYRLRDSDYSGDMSGPAVPVDVDPIVVTGTSDLDAPRVDPAGATWLTGTELDNATDNVVKLRVHVTDDLSGLPYLDARLVNFADRNTIVFMAPRLVSGTSTDGVWELVGTMPAFSPAGRWTVQLSMRDWVGHWRTYQVSDDGYTAVSVGSVEPAGFVIPSLTVTGESDMAPPVPEGIVFEGLTVFSNSVANTVTLRMRITDDLSGVEYAAVVLRFTSENGTVSGMTLTDPHLVSGTARDGVWEISGVLPQYAAAGTWQVVTINLYDVVKRLVSLQLGSDGVYRTANGEAVDLPVSSITVRDSRIGS